MMNLAAPYKAANAMELPPINDNNPDLFSEKIDYSSPDSRMNVPPQYNGNISAVTWHVAGRNNQAYGFKYDDLDRLTEANYFDISETYSGGQAFSNFLTDNKFQEKQTYDLRGNIISSQRNGYKLGSWTTNNYVAANYGLIDNLSYTYNAQNQVTRINDAAVNPNGPRGDKDLKGFVYDFAVGANDNVNHYTYDFNGNLKTDRHKEITNIEYNYLNLPQIITFSGSRTITFVYDASGAKLQKITNDNGIVTTYDYVNGVEYKNNVLQRLAHTEGSITRQNDGSYLQEYVLRDHLGNTRVTFTDANNDGVVAETDIKQINNYYPFGLNMEGNWNGAVGSNKYGYNGKEWNDDFGLGWNGYGARFYDPSIGRFTTVDLLAEHDYETNPYHYVNNNPMIFTDPYGLSGNWFQRAWHWIKTGGRESMDSDGRTYIKEKEQKKKEIKIHVGRTISSGPDQINDNLALNGRKFHGFGGLYWSQGGHVGIEYKNKVYNYYYATAYDPSKPFGNYLGQLLAPNPANYLNGGDGDHRYANGDVDNDGIPDAIGNDQYFSVNITASQEDKLSHILRYYMSHQNELPKYGIELGWRRRCTSMANTLLRDAGITSWWSRFYTASPHSYFNYLTKKFGNGTPSH